MHVSQNLLSIEKKYFKKPRHNNKNGSYCSTCCVCGLQPNLTIRFSIPSPRSRITSLLWRHLSPTFRAKPSWILSQRLHHEMASRYDRDTTPAISTTSGARRRTGLRRGSVELRSARERCWKGIRTNGNRSPVS